MGVWGVCRIIGLGVRGTPRREVFIHRWARGDGCDGTHCPLQAMGGT